MEKIQKEVLRLKTILTEQAIDTPHLVYMPLVPMVGQHEFVIEEHFGMKVARLISPPNE